MDIVEFIMIAKRVRDEEDDEEEATVRTRKDSNHPAVGVEITSEMFVKAREEKEK